MLKVSWIAWLPTNQKGTKKDMTKGTNKVPRPLVSECRAIYAKNDSPTKLHKASSMANVENTHDKSIGASINVIPKSIFEFLKLTHLKKTDILVEMVDMTKKAPIGIVENVLIKIKKFVFPFNFVVTDMLDERNKTMILGRIDEKGKLREWYCCHDDKRRGMTGEGLSFPDYLLVKYEGSHGGDLICDKRYVERKYASASNEGVDQVLEHGPWMIRNIPLFLNKWSPSLTLKKDEVVKVPVWLKMHKVPFVAYSRDDLSLIATQIGKPIVLDAFTSSICEDSWVRVNFARALVEISDDHIMKQKVSMAIPMADRSGYTKEVISVEYEWKLPHCVECKIFGHTRDAYPKRSQELDTITMEKPKDGFTEVSSQKRRVRRSGVDLDPKVQVGADASKKPSDRTTSNSFDVLNKVDVGDECGVFSSTGIQEARHATT
nr:hypothetical protein [Tanacetum cinerariifolium]